MTNRKKMIDSLVVDFDKFVENLMTREELCNVIEDELKFLSTEELKNTFERVMGCKPEEYFVNWEE